MISKDDLVEFGLSPETAAKLARALAEWDAKSAPDAEYVGEDGVGLGVTNEEFAALVELKTLRAKLERAARLQPELVLAEPHFEIKDGPDAFGIAGGNISGATFESEKAEYFDGISRKDALHPTASGSKDITTIRRNLAFRRQVRANGGEGAGRDR